MAERTADDILTAAGGQEVVRAPDGIGLAVYEWGNPAGPEILLIHGFAQCHLCFYRQIASDLAQRCRIVAYDQRGHGASDQPADPAAYQGEDVWAKDLAAVITAKDLKEYRSRTIMMLVVNLGSTIGFYGFANWVPTLLIAKGILVTKSLQYTFIIALAYPIFAVASVSFADRLERKAQVALASIGMAVCGVLFSMQTSPAILVVLGTIQTMLLTWLSFSFHNYQAEIYPTRICARAVGFVYSWSRFSAIFTGFLVAFFLKNAGVPGVFLLIGGCMLVVAGAVGFYGPRTNQLALEEIAR